MRSPGRTSRQSTRRVCERRVRCATTIAIMPRIRSIEPVHRVGSVAFYGPRAHSPVLARDTRAGLLHLLHRTYAKSRPVWPRHEDTVASLRKIRRCRFRTLRSTTEKLEKSKDFIAICGLILVRIRYEFEHDIETWSIRCINKFLCRYEILIYVMLRKEW